MAQKYDKVAENCGRFFVPVPGEALFPRLLPAGTRTRSSTQLLDLFLAVVFEVIETVDEDSPESGFLEANEMLRALAAGGVEGVADRQIDLGIIGVTRWRRLPMATVRRSRPFLGRAA